MILIRMMIRRAGRRGGRQISTREKISGHRI
jgi:hypothetical protein